MTPLVQKIIRKVCLQCNLCKKYAKSQPRPKASLPKATTFNETVSVDLKEVKTITENPRDKRYIAYMTDEFTRMTKGRVIPNKEKETVVEAIMKEWETKHFGPPRKSYHCDNGGEFANDEFRDLCNKEGINMTFSPAYSPWSNGLNERRHSVVDVTIKKLIHKSANTHREIVLQIAE